jgi:RHS repeat-associated protein
MLRRAKAESNARKAIAKSLSLAQGLPTPPPLPTPTPLPTPAHIGVQPLSTPTPRPGQPPGANLPNLDVMRTLQSVTPVVIAPGGKQPVVGMRCEFDCDPGGGGGEPPPTPPNDPNYSTPRTRPINRTGEPGITLGSRNFNWSVPLVSLTGRSGLDLNLLLTYNSLVWTREGGMIKFNADQGSPGPGFRLGFPIVQSRFYNPDTGNWSYMFVSSSGSRTDLRQIGSSNIYESFDSSYTQLIDNGGSLVVRTPDGTQTTFVMGSGNYVCSEIKDRNGNFISATYDGSRPTTITDTLGRVIVFNYSNDFLASITQTWGGVTHTWASFSYSSILLQYNFPGLQVNAPDNGTVLALPTQVGLDDGSSYQFTYNTWGQVYQISHIAPDGHQLSYTQYNLPTDSSTPQSDCPRFSEQREWAQDWNNGAEAVTQLGVDSDGGQVMITPDGTRYKELAYSSGWQNGLPYLEEVWVAGIQQKWVSYVWTQDNVNASYAINPRVQNIYVSDTTRSRATVISYSTFGLPSGTVCALPSDVGEYSSVINGVLLRRTHRDYNLDAAYLNQRVIGLESSRSVFDGNGTLFSKIDFHYDETGLQDPGAITQHDSNYSSGFVQGRGNLTSLTRFDANNLSQSTTSHITYNVAGSAVAVSDPLGHQSTLSYADSNGGNSFAFPTTVSDAGGNATTSQYNYDKGVLTQIQTPPPQGFTQGPIETRLYDDARRILQVTNSANGAYTRWVYDSGQTLIQSFATIQNGAGEAYSARVLDGAGRLRGTAQDHPGSIGQYSGQYISYDVMGRATQQSNPTEMNSQWIATGDDVTGWIYSTQAYDWNGRPTVTTNSDNSQRTISYGGCGCAGGEVTTLTDEAGRQRRKTADTFGRLVKVEELNWDSSVYATTTYDYDVLDHLTTINQAGQIRSFGYDGYGRLQTRTTPEQGTTSYSYFDDDTVQTVTDARGATTNLGYNARHLVTAVNYGVPGGVAATPNASFDYDAAGNRTSMTDGLGSVSYGYDQLSRLTSETRTFSGLGSYSLSYAYNLAGELTSVTNPWGSVVAYGYDIAGQVTGVTGSGQFSSASYSSSVTYRAFGGLKGMTYGNGRTVSAAYDNRLRPTTWNVSNVLGYNYNYDYFNERTGRVSYAQNIYDGSLDRSYQYDSQGRLAVSHSGAEARAHAFSGQWGTMDGPYSQGYDYDVWGNMTHRYGWGGEVQGGGANQTSHLYYSYTNNRRDGFSYDAAGNLTNDLGQTFTYDAMGQQASASYFSVQQYYDGDGMRVKKTENGTTRFYLRSTVLAGQVVAEMDGAGTWMRGYVYQGSNLLAVQAGGVNWVHEDPVTKSKRITDDQGNVVSAIELDPWGADTDRSSNAAFQPKKFTSYERDGNGSDDAMFRRYNRWHSRFDQPDPYAGSYNLADPQSLNRYSYVQNDPVTFVDPTGLMPQMCGLFYQGDGHYNFVCFGTSDPFRGFNPKPGGGTQTKPVPKLQTADECRAEALKTLASELGARQELFPSESAKAFYLVAGGASGAGTGGRLLGPGGAVIGGMIGVAVAGMRNDYNEAKIESGPVSRFNKASKKCDKKAKQEAAAAARSGPYMQAGLSQQFVVTRQFGVFALHAYTIVRGPTLLGDYIYEQHGANPTDPVRTSFRR